MDADETRHALLRLNAELVLVATVLGDARVDRARSLQRAYYKSRDPDHLIALAETIKGALEAYDLAEDAARQVFRLTAEEMEAEFAREQATQQRLDDERAKMLS